jgi:hypothetical protein
LFLRRMAWTLLNELILFAYVWAGATAATPARSIIGFTTFTKKYSRAVHWNG